MGQDGKGESRQDAVQLYSVFCMAAERERRECNDQRILQPSWVALHTNVANAQNNLETLPHFVRDFLTHGLFRLDNNLTSRRSGSAGLIPTWVCWTSDPACYTPNVFLCSLLTLGAGTSTGWPSCYSRHWKTLESFFATCLLSTIVDSALTEMVSHLSDCNLSHPREHGRSRNSRRFRLAEHERIFDIHRNYCSMCGGGRLLPPTPSTYPPRTFPGSLAMVKVKDHRSPVSKST